MAISGKQRQLAVLFAPVIFALSPCSFDAQAALPHYVFAHYMVCFATYGESIQGYKREIQEAQAAGIDGFALNVGAWSGPDSYYKSRVYLMYRAAENLGTGFKLFFSVDLGYTNDIVDMVSTYASRPNSFRYRGKTVLSSFGQNGLDWQTGVLAPLHQKGIDVFFVPHFWPNPVGELPSYGDVVKILDTYSNLLDGLFFFGGAGLPDQLVQCNSNYTKAVHWAGKVSMASYSPHYWGCVQNAISRRYFEFKGGEGTVRQWESIVQNQPDWVEIVTWNDFNESTYVSPVESPETWFPALRSPKRETHRGYLELSRRYISWYKTGTEPPIQDSLFYSYRTHSWNSTIANSKDVPVAWCIGDEEDMIYLTALLKAPAELRVSSGDKLAVRSLAAGVQHVRIPFQEGRQYFELWRDQHRLLQLTGPPITNTVPVWDCFPVSGCAVVSPSLSRLPDNASN